MINEQLGFRFLALRLPGDGKLELLEVHPRDGHGVLIQLVQSDRARASRGGETT